MHDEHAIFDEWFVKAHDDERACVVLLKEGLTTSACFHAQQMAEKYLKGLLEFLKIEIPKLHDLLKLQSVLILKLPGAAVIQGDLQLLNGYYIETRYPGDYPEFSQSEAEEALRAAEKVRDFVLAQLPTRT